MSEALRFQELAALELIRREGVRVVKTPPESRDELPWIGGWEEWSQILVGDGPGVQPSVFAFREGSGLDVASTKILYGRLVQQVLGRMNSAQINPARSVRVIAILYFDSIDGALAERLSRIVPDRFVQGLKPQVWVVDLGRGRLWAPRTLGVLPSRAQSAVKAALDETGAGTVATGMVLAEAQRRNEAERSVFMHRMSQTVPYVTYALLAAIFVVFALEYVESSGRLGGHVLLLFGALQPILIQQGQYWRLFTAMFVHVSVVHILFNSIALYSVGTLVERIYGSLRYIVIYVVSGLVASFVSYEHTVLSGKLHVIAAGASGAIFGIAGVVIVLGVLRRSIVPRAVALQLSIFMLVLIVVNLGFDFVTPEIDYSAHIGGLAVGLLLGYVLSPRLPADGSAAVASAT